MEVEKKKEWWWGEGGVIKGWGPDDVSMDGCRQGREGEGKRSKHDEGQGEAHNGRPRAESPSGVAADTLTVAFHAADSLSGSFFGGRRTDALRVLS